MEVVHRVEKLCPEGFGFVKFDTASKRWHAVPRTISRMNVAQAFRDYLSPCYRSSKHSKRHRRLQEKGYTKGTDAKRPSLSLATAAAAAAAAIGRDLPVVDPEPISIVSALGSQQRKAASEYNSGHCGFTALQTLQQLRGDGVFPSAIATPCNRGTQGLAHYIEEAFERMDDCGTLTKEPLSILTSDSQEQQQQQYQAPSHTAPSVQDLLLEPLPPEDEQEDDVDEELKRYQQTQQQQQQQPQIQHQSRAPPPMRMNINMNLNLNMMRPTNTNVVPRLLAQQQQQQQGGDAFAASEQTSAFFLQGMGGAKASNYSCSYNNGYSFGNNYYNSGNNTISNSDMPYHYDSM